METTGLTLGLLNNSWLAKLWIDFSWILWGRELERLDFFLPPHYMAMTSLAMAPHLAFNISDRCQVLSSVPSVLVFNFNLLTLCIF